MAVATGSSDHRHRSQCREFFKAGTCPREVTAPAPGLSMRTIREILASFSEEGWKGGPGHSDTDVSNLLAPKSEEPKAAHP